MAEVKAIEALVDAAPDTQVSLTDPDARAMSTNARSSGTVGYNVQTAVDTTHHLIVAHEVTNVGSDRRQLANMAKQAQAVIAPSPDQPLKAVADEGYYRGEELLACDEANIESFVKKSDTSGKRGKGEFGRREFHYIAEDDEYECPAKERLIYRFTTADAGKQIRRYWSSACIGCPIKSQCTPSTYRRVSRWEHEATVEAAEARMAKHPEMMRVRRATVEHPFGTLKAWMGSTHFLTRTLDRVSTEMSLHVLAYNLKRMISIYGVRPLIEAMKA